MNHQFPKKTNLIFSRKKLETIIESVINKELKHLVKWSTSKKLSINETMTDLSCLDRLGSIYILNLILDVIIVNSNYILVLNT